MEINYASISAAGTSPVGLVVRLYETVIGDLGRAVAAVRDDDVERRTFELRHALAVIGQLQGCLDMTAGGEPAKELDRFYDIARARILQAQLRHSGKMLEETMRDFLLVRDAWAEVEQQTTTGQKPQGAAEVAENGNWVA